MPPAASVAEVGEIETVMAGCVSVCVGALPLQATITAINRMARGKSAGLTEDK